MQLSWSFGTVAFVTNERLFNSQFPCIFHGSAFFLQLNDLLGGVVLSHRFLVAFSTQIRYTRAVLLGFCIDG
jgi:hypothetical protein